MENSVEFETKVKQGMIYIPEEYQHKLEQNRFAQSPSKICDLDGVSETNK